MSFENILLKNLNELDFPFVILAVMSNKVMLL